MDAAKYRTPPRKGRQCLVGRTLDHLDDDRAGFLRQLIGDPAVMWSKIEEHSTDDFGVRLPAQTVSRHARGLCTCD